MVRTSGNKSTVRIFNILLWAVRETLIGYDLWPFFLKMESLLPSRTVRVLRPYGYTNGYSWNLKYPCRNIRAITDFRDSHSFTDILRTLSMEQRISLSNNVNILTVIHAKPRISIRVLIRGQDRRQLNRAFKNQISLVVSTVKTLRLQWSSCL